MTDQGVRQRGIKYHCNDWLGLAWRKWFGLWALCYWVYRLRITHPLRAPRWTEWLQATLGGGVGAWRSQADHTPSVGRECLKTGRKRCDKDGQCLLPLLPTDLSLPSEEQREARSPVLTDCFSKRKATTGAGDKYLCLPPSQTGDALGNPPTTRKLVDYSKKCIEKANAFS